MRNQWFLCILPLALGSVFGIIGQGFGKGRVGTVPLGLVSEGILRCACTSLILDSFGQSKFQTQES